VRYTRQAGTHNRYFPDEKELTGTLSRVFGEMQTYPNSSGPICNLFVIIMSLYLCASV